MILEKISFLLKKPADPAHTASLTSMLRAARASMEEDGVTTELFRGDISSERGSSSRTLYLSDFAGGLSLLKSAGLPCAGWRHSLNPDEDLSSASYILEDLPEIDMDDFEKVYERETGLPWTILTTERLLVREFTDSPEDLHALYRIYSDPEAARFLSPLLPDPEEERRALRSYIKNVYEFYGFGSFAVVRKDTGEVIGRAGFGLPDSAAASSLFIPSFGYVIREDCRGQGFAAEVCAPLLAYGFDVLSFDAVTAEANEENVPSLRLLRSLGFREVTDAAGEASPKDAPAVISGNAGAVPSSKAPSARCSDTLSSGSAGRILKFRMKNPLR